MTTGLSGPATILVTGATGYLGMALVSHIFRTLTESNVIAMVSSDEQGAAFSTLIDPVFRSRLLFRKGRLPHQIPDLSGIDAVVHLAGVRKAESKSSQGGTPDVTGDGAIVNSGNNALLSVNREGTAALIDAARTGQIKHFIFVSSQSVYGTQWPVPWNESQLPQPQGMYASSKYAAELLFHDIQEFSTTIFRVPRVYGASMYHGIRGLEWNEVPSVLISRAVHGKELKIVGDGSQTYDFLHLRDLCSAVERALLVPSLGCRILNLSSSNPISMKALAELCCEVASSLGVQEHSIVYESRDDVPPSFGLDSELARRELEWRSEVTMRAGIEELMKCVLSEKGA